jgi:protocatechuate 3,4-dioxygenase beta subunit
MPPADIQADPAPERSIDLKTCTPTPAVLHSVTVPPIYKSNNLRRRTGYATYASGKFITIRGVLTDKNCVPISNATIQIWHADSHGIYKSAIKNDYLNDRKMYGDSMTRFQSSKPFNSGSDKNFTGSGSAVTDNLGRFVFLTIMPGSVSDKDPFISMRVIHRDFQDLDTIMHFNQRNHDGNLAVPEPEVYKSNPKEAVYLYNIVLPEANKKYNF